MVQAGVSLSQASSCTTSLQCCTPVTGDNQDITNRQVSLMYCSLLVYLGPGCQGKVTTPPDWAFMTIPMTFTLPLSLLAFLHYPQGLTTTYLPLVLLSYSWHPLPSRKSPSALLLCLSVYPFQEQPFCFPPVLLTPCCSPASTP